MPSRWPLPGEELMESAKNIFFTGTHFFSGVPFAAALACIDEIQASGAIEYIRKTGTMLMDGLQASRRRARRVRQRHRTAGHALHDFRQ